MRQVRSVSWMVTAGLLLVGLLLQFSGVVAFGWVFFMLFPVGVGFASVIASGNAGQATWVLGMCILGLVIFLALAIIFGLEGLICALMAMPLLLLALFFGAAIAFICRKTI